MDMNQTNPCFVCKPSELHKTADLTTVKKKALDLAIIILKTWNPGEEQKKVIVKTWYHPRPKTHDPMATQFTVKHEQNIDRSGNYIKLFDCKLKQAAMYGESPNNIVFGPDTCGPSTKKALVIFEHNNKNHLITDNINPADALAKETFNLKKPPTPPPMVTPTSMP